jgi:hypothetical protein
LKSQCQLLPLWTEAVGTLHGFSCGDSHIYVKIGERLLCFPVELTESEVLLTGLHKELIGQKIGLLRTDRRLLVRLIDNGGVGIGKTGKSKRSKRSKG